MVQIMGIVNLNGDSFYAPSRVEGPQALGRIRRMAADGADIIDIGAVSTRPGAAPVSLEEEWKRLSPVLQALSKTEIPFYAPSALPRFSIDTVRAEIVRRSYETIGPLIVNDISAGEDDPGMLLTVGGLGLPYIAMHKRGTPETMDTLTDYSWASDGQGSGVVEAVLQYFQDFGEAAAEAGVRNWILDPGFGFAKTRSQNLELLSHLNLFRRFGKPVLAALADKRFTIVRRTGRNRTEELHAQAVRHGADMLRVHDVAAARKTLQTLHADE
ncbi:MAG: dihydropteroate synthase [Bacteroidales bacterium]|nr:dihydropteroate synthase [Bacteroidales bacterium]